MSEEEVNQEVEGLPEDTDLEEVSELDEAEELAQKEALRAQLLEAKAKRDKEKALQSEDCPPCNKGSPAWMATFADMATLLMAFFVLILSFAEMKVPKYKQVSGSLQNAFGVQRAIPVVEPPTAQNIVATQYKSAEVAPTIMNVIEEETTDQRQPEDVELRTDTKTQAFETNSDEEIVERALAQEIAAGKVKVKVEGDSISVQVISSQNTGTKGDSNSRESGGQIPQEELEIFARIAAAQSQVQSLIQVEAFSPSDAQDGSSRGKDLSKQRAVENQYARLRAELSEEINSGLAEVLKDGDKVIVRLAEQGSFRSGFADLQPQSLKLLSKVGASLSPSSGLITVEGHTDNIPIAFSERFNSNWDLSAARSAAVADFLVSNTDVAEGNVTVTGYAETRPLAPNTTSQGRAKNRRIEIVVEGGS